MVDRELSLDNINSVDMESADFDETIHAIGDFLLESTHHYQLSSRGVEDGCAMDDSDEGAVDGSRDECATDDSDVGAVDGSRDEHSSHGAEDEFAMDDIDEGAVEGSRDECAVDGSRDECAMDYSRDECAIDDSRDEDDDLVDIRRALLQRRMLRHGLKHPGQSMLTRTTPCPTSSSIRSAHGSTPPSHDSSCSNLVPQDDDPLIPSASDVSRTFHDGSETWAFFLGKALDMAPGLWPADTLNPYIALGDVPALPSSLPRDFICGRPMWEIHGCAVGQHDMWTARLVPGRRVEVLLGISKPTRCHLVSTPASRFLGVTPKVTNSLAILTICWSYILSVRLLEMQGRRVWYTDDHNVWPREMKGCDRPAVHLDGASPALVRWLCGILCCDFGWRTNGVGLPPWAMVLSHDVLLATSDKPPMELDSVPPSSNKAVRLLVELCQLLDLGSDTSADGWESLPAYKAGFLAALMIPYYNEMQLQPQFSVPHLETPQASGFSAANEWDICRYGIDLRYFMTLSVHPPSLGSTLWSVFWQPDVECHLVSPWLRSALATLEPTMEALRLEDLVKTFASRRPRVALWWLGLFLLGDVSAVSWIRRYANKLDERFAFASLSSPDPIFSAWTGVKQSFLDEKSTSAGAVPGKVSRADLLRYRFNFKLQGDVFLTPAWQPFGHVDRSDVEVDLWPCVDAKCNRSYHSFNWYASGMAFPTSLGFRQETSRAVGRVHDDLDRHSPSEAARAACSPEMKAAPSRTSTLQMFSLLVEDASGVRHIENAAMPDILQNRWLQDWDGLRTVDSPMLEVDVDVDKAAAREEPPEPLLEWLKRAGRRSETSRFRQPPWP